MYTCAFIMWLLYMSLCCMAAQGLHVSDCSMRTLQCIGLWALVQGQEIEGPGEGFLCMKAAWPSTIRTIYGDQDRFETTYFAHFKVHPRVLEIPNLVKGYFCVGNV